MNPNKNEFSFHSIWCIQLIQSSLTLTTSVVHLYGDIDSLSEEFAPSLPF